MQHIYSQAALSALPTVTRARGYYLYCQNGRRIFDMYLANGQLAYGHKPFSVSRHIKRAIDQGLLCDLPHRYHTALTQVCARIFKQYRYWYFAPSVAAFIRAIRLYRPYLLYSKKIIDPAYGTTHNSIDSTPLLAYYRAHLPTPNATILLPLIPFPYLAHVQLICSKIKLECVTSMQYANAFDSMAIMHMLRAMHSNRHGHVYSDKRADIIDPLTHNAHHALSQWRHNGNYLHSSLKSKKYSILFNTLLTHNILINPSTTGITLLPTQMPKKEYLKFVQISDTMQ